MSNSVPNSSSTELEKWDFKTADYREVLTISKKFNVSADLARILCIRNIGNGHLGSLQDFLFPPKSLLTSFEEITDPQHLRAACDRLARALEKKEALMINGDPDADGISGTTILAAGLRTLGFTTHYDFPTRSTEGHGLQPRIIEKAKSLNAKVILTADCGSNNFESTDYAKTLGIDVIVCDHHILGKERPNACAMVNPFMIDHPTADQKLAGAGVCFKFIMALFHSFQVEMPQSFRDYLISIAALGTLSDRMTLLAPINRLLIKKGVQTLQHTPMEGLKALRDMCIEPSDKLNSRAVSLNLVPRLNAPGRIGDPDKGIMDSNIVVDLLLLGRGRKNAEIAQTLMQKFWSVFQLDWANKKAEAEAAVESEAEGRSDLIYSTLYEVEKVNDRRKQLTSNIEDSIEESLRDEVDISGRIIIVKGHNWNPGVIGINADRLRERFLKPVIVLTQETGSDYIRGSVRSIPSINIYRIIEKAGDDFKERTGKHLFELKVKTALGERVIYAFGGHSQACGFTIHKDNLPTFISAVKAEMALLPTEQLQYVYEVIDTLQPQDITISLYTHLDKLDPFGNGFEFPIYALHGCSVGSKPRPFGNKYQKTRTPHVDFQVVFDRHSHNRHHSGRLKAVGFGMWEKFFDLVKVQNIEKFDILFFLELRTPPRRKNRKTKGSTPPPELRLNVVDMRPAVVTEDAVIESVEPI